MSALMRLRTGALSFGVEQLRNSGRGEIGESRIDVCNRKRSLCRVKTPMFSNAAVGIRPFDAKRNGVDVEDGRESVAKKGSSKKDVGGSTGRTGALLRFVRGRLRMGAPCSQGYRNQGKSAARARQGFRKSHLHAQLVKKRWSQDIGGVQPAYGTNRISGIDPTHRGQWAFSPRPS